MNSRHVLHLFLPSGCQIIGYKIPSGCQIISCKRCITLTTISKLMIQEYILVSNRVFIQGFFDVPEAQTQPLNFSQLQKQLLSERKNMV